MSELKGHAWSGWPGARCTRCGAEHTLETALALNWFRLKKDDLGQTIEVWKSEKHKQFVHLCDGSCCADMTSEECQKFKAAVENLSKELNLEDD